MARGDLVRARVRVTGELPLQVSFKTFVFRQRRISGCRSEILTFNWHESYIHLLAKTGYDFDVVEKEKAGIRGWIRAIRPVPENCSLVTEAEARARLDTGTYDRIIAHNLGDLLSVRGVETPKVLVFHNKLSTEIALGKDPVDKSEYLERVSRLFRRNQESEPRLHLAGEDGGLGV